MNLKRLEIKGFKSFADHTELNFNPGINIIVGPNGCGKSNIVDAIRWVLGEGNVRHLRGRKNEDVIFNGTDKKKALSMAQVDMTVDNSEGILPLEYGEITVSRKIFRSGESEFYLNKSRVRMKDIVKLFTDTGLGKRGYSIISQGELERVINGEPLDRRLMLEEAAGTMGYRQQRDEVEQRIRGTAQDLLRVEDIVQELRNRMAELAFKAEKAQTYLALRQEHDNLEKRVIACRIKEIGENLATRGAEAELKHSELATLLSQLETWQVERQKELSRLEQKRVHISQLQESKYTLTNEINKMASEVKLSQERINNHGERIAAAVKDGHKYEQMLEKLQKDLQLKVTDFDQEKALCEDRQNQVKGLVEEIKQLELSMAEQEKVWEKHNQDIFTRATMEAQTKNEITALEHEVKKALEKNERLTVRCEGVNKQLTAARQNGADLQIQKSKYDEARQEWANIIKESSRQEEALLASQATLDQEYDKIKAERMQAENKLLSLKELQRSYTGYSEGVRSLLKFYASGDSGLDGIKGVVSELVLVPPGMELSTSVALGKGMENIVVETGWAAQKAIQLLKQKRWGRVTFLPLDVLRVQMVPIQIRQEVKKEPGVIGRLADLVKYDREYSKAVEYLLGRVLLVEDINCGLGVYERHSYPWRIITLDGEVINTYGAMTGGTYKPAPTNPLMRKQEENKMRQQVANLQKSEKTNRAAAAESARLLKRLADQLIQAKNGNSEAEFQLKMIRAEEQRLTSLIQESSLDLEAKLKERSQLEQYISCSELEIEALRISLREHSDEENALHNEIELMRNAMESQRREYEVKRERYSSLQEQIMMKQRELKNSEKNIAQFTQVKTSYQQSIMEAQRLMERLRSEMIMHEDKLERTNRSIMIKKDELKTVISGLELSSQAETEVNSNLKIIEAHITKDNEQVLIRRDQIRALEMKTVRLEAELEGLRNQWLDKYKLEEPSDYYQPLSHRQVKEFQSRIENLRTEIELLGSIDLDSIQEHDDIKERYSFLNQQMEDLNAAKSSLESLLRETEKIMASNLADFIQLAQESFRHTFINIFDGGDASLDIDSVTDLSAGVDIRVKLPGKRSQSLNLLSGGERALTCIAFIFSLLRLKPAPFCLLDEIDASLDEVNLLRFADFLSNMSQATQFIVITHRQTTIEAGGNIYGITMPQEGISSVLSIQGDDVQSLAG